MRPRGMRSRWRKATVTYWYERRQPSRAAELDEALLDYECQMERIEASMGYR